MKRKTEFKSTEKVAGIKLQRNNYEVIVHYYNNTKEVNYIQVIKNRKKISNFQSLELAERKMMAEAMLDLNQTTINFDEKKNWKLVILDYSKTYGWSVKYEITENAANEIIQKEQLIKDEESYIDSWYTKERYKRLKELNIIK